jgi:glutathione S-transferase
MGKDLELTLYYHPLSSFCHKVLIALYESDTVFEKHIINLGDAADRSELQALWPFCKFPVVRDHVRQRNLPESSVIIEYLDHFFAWKHPLIPHDFDAALQARLWDRIFDNHVQGPMQEVVLDRIRNANGDLAKARSTLDTAYGVIDRQAASNTWIAGDAFSLADCAAAPALFYAGTLQPFPDHCIHLTAYFDKLVHRPSVQRVLEEAKPYFSLYPFQSTIPQRFL